MALAIGEGIGQDRLQIPPAVLCNRVFLFLHHTELLACSEVSKDWNEASKNDICWHHQCKLLWHGKADMPYSYPGCKKPAIFAKCRLSTQCIQKLPIKEMSHILRERGMNYLQFLERSEFIKAVVQSQPAEVMGWSHRYDHKFFAYFVYSYLDGKRNDITKEELTKYEWKCYLGLGDERIHEGYFTKEGRWILTGEPPEAPKLW